jgi:hypothetical protein
MSTPELMARVEALSLELDAAPAGPVVDAARDLCVALLQIHRQAFEALLARPGDPAAFSENDAVRAALALHGLEPAPAEMLVPAERLTARLRDQAPADDRCERCGASLSSEHEHALAGDGALICVCAPCALAGGTVRIRDKIERASGVSLDDAAWSALDIPVGLAFFVRRRDGSFVARYPGPHGLCETEVADGAWRTLAGTGDALEPEVEALLVHRRGGARAAYRVSIDRCHALAGLIRKTWRGLGGGAEADRAIESFFATLERREVAHA